MRTKRHWMALSVVLCGSLAGCTRSPQTPARIDIQKSAKNSLSVLLAAHAGDGRTDIEIRKRQQQIREGKQTDTALERLGWLFVRKARESFDPGFYKLAEQCAFALEAHQPHSANALL